MSAYAVLIRERIVDPAEMANYSAKAKLARAGFEVTPLAYYGEVESVEGPTADGVVILEFADLATAQRWYHGPEYQAAKVHRLKGAEYRVLLVDGVKPAA